MKNITVQTSVHASLDKVWDYWTAPVHIMRWNHASDDWECPRAENDLRAGGIFSFTMSAKDGSVTFDFGGTYTEVRFRNSLSYTLGDERKVSVTFKEEGDEVHITETFDMEEVNSEEKQRSGWQAILENFKNYVETH